MKSLQELDQDLQAVMAVNNISSAFEGISSMRIAQIKNQVVNSQQFFDKLWEMYRQIRVGKFFHYGRQEGNIEVSAKELYVAITAEGSFSGDIDERLITEMLRGYDPAKQDIIVIGHHGAIQLVQKQVSFLKYFKMPLRDSNINVTPIIREIQRYRSTSVFYQSYESLLVQNVKRISMENAIEERGKSVTSDLKSKIISEETFIFEPSTYAVVDHLERSMMNIALSQTILESKLAQYASRFKAMTSSRTRSDELLDELRLSLNRTKREIGDERLREVIGARHNRQERFSS